MKFQNQGAVLVQFADLFIQVAPSFISPPYSQISLLPIEEPPCFLTLLGGETLTWSLIKTPGTF